MTLTPQSLCVGGVMLNKASCAATKFAGAALLAKSLCVGKLLLNKTLSAAKFLKGAAPRLQG